MEKTFVLLNITGMLRQREYGCKNFYRKNLKILKAIICHGKTEYRKVYEQTSPKYISCDGNHIFFDNYRYHYSGINLSCSPHLYYTLPKVSTNKKIHDALILHSCQDSLTLPKGEQKDRLITITADNYLRVYNLYTGAIYQDIFISSIYNFRELSWNVDQECFVIKSVHIKSSQFHRQAGVIINILMSLVIFDVLPFKFIGMLEIDKRIWGKDVVDAMITGGMLILMFQSGLLRVYSFSDILDKYQGNTCSAHLNNNEGLPITIKITESPPVLFEVKCSQYNVQIGGFPWHYMITPYGSLGRFVIYSFDTNKIIQDGHLDFDSDSLEVDRAIFHGDESGRVLHIGDNIIRMLEITTDEDDVKLKPSFDIVIKDTELTDKLDDMDTYSTSGRKIKRKFSLDEITNDKNEVNIYSVDYENELDAICVNSVIRGTEKTEGFIGLYDNYNGKLLRQIQLQEPYSEFTEHKVIMDCDTIIQIIKADNSKFHCTVYRLFGNCDSDVIDKNSRRKDVRTSQRNRPRRR